MTKTDSVATLPNEEEFRAKVRSFLESHTQRLDPDRAGSARARRSNNGTEAERLASAKRWQRALYDAGLAALTWPREYGGQGLPIQYEAIYREELSQFDDAAVSFFVLGLGISIPTILSRGTDEQKKRFVARAAKGEEVWCVFLSEPGAGSDLGSVQTRAVRDGDLWRVNGQKVWTSGAQNADVGVLLARTNPELPKHKGLTMFIVDLKTPGITVRPLHQINGESEFNEVFFDNVEVPVDRMLGDVGQGWGILISFLMHERMFVAKSGTTKGSATKKQSALEPIMVQVSQARAQHLTDDPRVRDALARLYINTRTANLLALRAEELAARASVPGPEGSMVKLTKALLAIEAAHLSLELGGPGAVAWDDASDPDGGMLVHEALTCHGLSLGGGTNNIQRNVISERILGLPKDPEIDRNLPFRDLKVGTEK